LAALNGETAINLCREHIPDVVLLDIGLPDIDGYEVASKLRSEVGFKGKIIAISGYEADSTLQAAFGVNLHLRKPLRLDALCEVLTA
jgi:two-component system CheB/CheR fusion protein